MARGAGNYGLGPIYYYLFPIISKEESYISRCKTLCDGRKKSQHNCSASFREPGDPQ